MTLKRQAEIAQAEAEWWPQWLLDARGCGHIKSRLDEAKAALREKEERVCGGHVRNPHGVCIHCGDEG